MADGVIPAGYRVYPPKVNIYGETVGRALAERHGERAALLWPGGSMTYSALDEHVGRVAAGLATHGVGPGTPFLMRSDNRPSAVITLLAAFRLGALVILSNSQLRKEEVRYLLENSDARIAAAPSHLAEPLLELLGECALARVILLDGVAQQTGSVAYEELAASRVIAPVADTGSEDPAFMVYSSGTTGRPKGILHAQRWAITLGDMVVLHNEYEPGDVTMTPGEFSFMGTFGNNLIGPLRAGATVALFWDRATPCGVLAAAASYKVNKFLSVPTFYRRVLAEAGAEENLDLSRVLYFTSAGESLGASVKEQWEARFPFPLCEIYGVSEVMTCIANTLYDPRKAGSMGKGLPGLRMEVMNERLEPVPLGEPGRLMIHRSDPGMFICYYKDWERWRAAHKADWYDTGDVVRRDEEGYFFYAGRKDDLFKSRGYLISPQEVENALLKHGAVEEAAVIGIPDEAYGNRIAAFVKLIPGYKARPDLPSAILAETAEHLAPYKLPKELSIVDEIPKNAVGKILRSVLSQ